jgi:hypothetical protein
MSTGRTPAQTDKLSPEFAGRLRQLRSGEKVRAMVLLESPRAAGSGRRQTAAERNAAMAAVRESGAENLLAVDAILRRFGGERLADRPNVLGAVPVEITAAGVHALAASEAVKAVLEDQAIRPAV